MQGFKAEDETTSLGNCGVRRHLYFYLSSFNCFFLMSPYMSVFRVSCFYICSLVLMFMGWGAVTLNMTNNGFVISDQSLNQIFNNASFIVHCLRNVSYLDKSGVISVWDTYCLLFWACSTLKYTTESDSSSPNTESPPSESKDVECRGRLCRGYNWFTQLHGLWLG